MRERESGNACMGQLSPPGLGIPGTRYVHYGAWLYVYPVGTVLLTKRTMQTLYVTFEPMNIAIDESSLHTAALISWKNSCFTLSQSWVRDHVGFCFFVFFLLCNAQCKQTDCGLLRKRGQVSARRTSSCGGMGLRHILACVCVCCVCGVLALCVCWVSIYIMLVSICCTLSHCVWQ